MGDPTNPNNAPVDLDNGAPAHIQQSLFLPRFLIWGMPVCRCLREDVVKTVRDALTQWFWPCYE